MTHYLPHVFLILAGGLCLLAFLNSAML